MSWIELLIVIPLVLVACRVIWLRLGPGPRPRWKFTFFAAAIVGLGGLNSVLNNPELSWLWWGAFGFGMAMMLVALFVQRPRGEMLP